MWTIFGSIMGSFKQIAGFSGTGPGSGGSQGRLLMPYVLQNSKAGGKLSCIEETTGRILWDVPIPRSDTGSIGGFTASPHHVFVSHWTYLDIFQLADGAHTATIGVW